MNPRRSTPEEILGIIELAKRLSRLISEPESCNITYKGRVEVDIEVRTATDNTAPHIALSDPRENLPWLLTRVALAVEAGPDVVLGCANGTRLHLSARVRTVAGSCQSPG